MLFNSLEFLLFLPIVFTVYWLLKGNLRLQNVFIVIASYTFYGWWNYKFLFLIAFTSLCSFYSGIIVYKHDSTNIRKLTTAINIVINLSILCLFKYYNFFIENFVFLLSNFGLRADWPLINVILPVGISFYTFQALSYTIDVYRGKIDATHDIISFFAFISFFPQLVAGPIERATNLLPQFQNNRTFSYPIAADGCRQMLWGFFKKVVVADNAAFFVQMFFDNPDKYSSVSLLIGAVLFSIQIYCDFSGYSDIAIGCAKLFGIHLMANFRFPYFSRNLAEFWRRWHISLNKWFVDYVYIPLGGSRVAKPRVILNTFIIFLLSGLWHGANWTFVSWGLLHSLFFIPLVVFKKTKQFQNVVAEHSLLPSPKELCLMLSTFIIVMFAWVFFRCESISDAFSYIAQMVDFHTIRLDSEIKSKHFLMLSAFILILFVVEWIQRLGMHGLQRLPENKPLRYSIYFAIIYAIMWFGGNQADFIYFQF